MPLVPYAVSYLANPYSSPVLHLARIELATRKIVRLSFQLPSTTGNDEATSVRLG